MSALLLPESGWFVRPDGENGAETIHGVGHSWRVGVHARELAESLGLPRWEREALRLAALWHDIGRDCDGRDHFHGAKSAGKAVGLGLHRGVEPAVLEVALLAVTYHSTDDRWGEEAAEDASEPESALRVFRILKDADALDRVRLGPKSLDTAMPRFRQSKRRVERAWELFRSPCPSPA